MAEFTSYDQETGEIVSLISGSQRDAEMDGPYVNGHYDPELYRVVNGKPERKADKEIEEKKAKKDWLQFKQDRNALLNDSDKAMMPDRSTDKEAWATYRQALRDLPANTTDPANPDWPTPPSDA